MNCLGLWECFVLVCVWIAGLAGFLIGGMQMLGYVVQAFLVIGFGWVVRQLYLSYAETLRYEYARGRAFADWANRQDRLKGLDS